MKPLHHSKRVTADEPVKEPLIVLTRKELEHWASQGKTTAQPIGPRGNGGEEPGNRPVGAWGRRSQERPGSFPAEILSWCGGCGATLRFQAGNVLLRACPLCGWRIPR